MIKYILSKIIGNPKQKKDGNVNEGMATKLSEKSQHLAKFVGKQIEVAKEEILIIRSKCKNLRETNYNLGLKHLENGNLSDAIFRFRFTKKFWPDLFDAHYQLAYSLVLNKELHKAKDVLEELLIKKPDYPEKARELLNKINSSLSKEGDL